ncbi:F-box domain-containing protein [Mycena indigotica]|uniref:F-box domain-containing protein n=1 Tax=Mycena indigotica TaxID=2126181 RepID=A0A8H6SGI8_9AGAR|nr:F-box domain-containing protein [Mycena indigotica]KAF7298538.1 F-box domain-containing protein [Mycena indigotica]
MPSSTLPHDNHLHSGPNPPQNTPASAPILCLPTELLLSILERCVDDNPGEDDEPLSVLAKDQWLSLSTVCSHWHGVIIGTPMIWADINAWSIPTQQDARAVELVQRALLRAENAPLRLNLDVVQTYHAQTGQPIRRQILAVLRATSERWQSLSLRVDPCQLLDLAPMRGKLPLLERLELSRSNNANDRQFFAACNLFEIAPALRSLTFEDFPPRVAWHQLTEVRLNITFGFYGHFHKAVYNALAFVEHCSASCSVMVWDINPPYHRDQQKLADWPTQPLFKSPIRSFTLAPSSFSSDDEQVQLAGRILRLLSLPNLTELKLQSTCPAANFWDPAAFATFTRRSPNITVLHLRQTYISSPALLQALRQVPLLEDLAVEDLHQKESYHFAVTDEVLRELLEPSLARNLCRLEIRSFVQFDHDLLLQVLRLHAQRTGTASGGNFVFRAVVLAMTKAEAEYGARADEGRRRLAETLEQGYRDGLRFTIDVDVV